MPNKQLPNGWRWCGGEVAGRDDGYKTYWFETNLRYHYRGALFTDPGEPWTVHFFEEQGKRADGDVDVCEYPCRTAQFETEGEALDWLCETATALLHKNLQ
jgi:hypothetical protein